MSHYIAAICTNGHMISSTLRSPNYRLNFCEDCGAKIVTACKNCNTPIEGDIMDDPSSGIVFFLSSPPVPKYCPHCGNPYPWTEKAALSLVRMLREENELENDLIEHIEESIPDTISETPGTELAAIRFKKVLSHTGSIVSDAVKQYLAAYGCDKIKSLLESIF